MRREFRSRFHLRHRTAQTHVVRCRAEPRYLRLIHPFTAILDIRLRVILVGWRKARHDGTHRGTAVFYAVCSHQHDPSPDAVLARFKLHEALQTPVSPFHFGPNPLRMLKMLFFAIIIFLFFLVLTLTSLQKLKSSSPPASRTPRSHTCSVNPSESHT